MEKLKSLTSVIYLVGISIAIGALCAHAVDKHRLSIAVKQGFLEHEKVIYRVEVYDELEEPVTDEHALIFPPGRIKAIELGKEGSRGR